VAAKAIHRCRWGAITLIELLVVIAIFTVLVGLLLPAVQKIRESAARATCANNLKQVGLALHAYHDAKSGLPPGISLDGGRSPQPFLSWNARILPYLERQALWSEIERAFAQSRSFYDVPPHVHRSTVVATYACPSDGRTLAPSTKLGTATVVAFTSYLGISGTFAARTDGVLFADSAIRMADIRDGTSSTLLVGERPPSPDERLGWWYAGTGTDDKGSAEMLLGVVDYNYYRHTYHSCDFGPYAYGPGDLNNDCDTFHYWSLHPGGAQFVFCDGSVRFLAYSANSILLALATRAGNEAVTLPD
jgi:prepilin-type processing-associated H-X9-DG protein